MSEEPSSSQYRPGGLEFQLPPTSYQTSDSYDPGPAGLFFHIVRLFVHIVQPNAFPEDILRKTIQKKFDPSKEYDKIIYYEIGIIICAALGLLFVVLMPLVGFFFCLCRCCNKCGGEMHQRQKRSGPFLKKCYTISLLVICVFIRQVEPWTTADIGIIYGFAANQYMRTRMEETRKLSDSNFNDLRTLLNVVPGQIDYILDQFTHPKEKAFDDLDNINSLVGDGIYEHLKPKVLPVLKDIKDLAKDMKANRDTLVQANTVLTDVKHSSAYLRTSLRDVKTSMEQTLTDPQCSFPAVAPTCNSIRKSLSVLDDSANFDHLPSLDGHITQLDGLLQTDLSSLVQKANESLSNIPEEVQNQTRDFITEFKKTLNSIQSDVKNISTKIPIQKTLSSFVRYINNSEDYILHYLPTIEECDSYSGAGFSFFFSWMVMTIVVLTFVAGGNMEKLVCEPYRNKKLFQVLDTPYLLNEDWKYYLSGLVLNKPDVNLTFEQVYSDCKENKGLYATLKLDHIYNVSEQLNITKTERSPTRVNLISFANDIQRKANQLVRVSTTIFFLNSTQDFLTSQLSKIVVEESKQFGSKIISYFEWYLQWVEMTITQQFAACKPAATAVDSAVNVFLCSYIVDPLNLFWFGMGKATMLLLPAVIFAVKLAKYFRRMYSEDVYEDDPVNNRVKKKRINFLCSNIMKSKTIKCSEVRVIADILLLGSSSHHRGSLQGCAQLATGGSHQAEGMRTHGLTLLSLLLLAVLMLLAEAKKEGRKRHGSKASTEESHALGKPGKEPRSQPTKHPIKGKFVTPDHADCRWAVTKQEEGIVLKVECTQQDNTFSCFFTGNPTSCLELHKSSVYWKQIGRNLRSQKVICGDAKSVLKTRVCRKKFPESNLKLVNSTLIRIKKPSQELMEPSPMDTVEVTTSSNPEKTQTMTTKGPQCEDEDLENQRKAAQEYCGEVWGSLCRFFLSMVQGSSC
ncbi:hypothetical protein MJT46_005257 [Ovis ammon polii x Ovis aries]|nr:hypothetical protein MJT46_005257 [Ovis ammon polii x Ovis aries]